MSLSGELEHRASEAPRLTFALLFCLALLPRLLLVPKLNPSYLVPHTRWETSAIAWSLYAHGTFADPYALPTGPTAHAPPIGPALTALLYRIFGFGTAAAYAGVILSLIAAALLAAMLPWVSKRLGLGHVPGLVAGLALVVGPMSLATVETLSAIALALVTLTFAERWTGGERRRGCTLLLGAAIGFALHVNPALLSPVVGLLLVDVVRFGDGGRWRGTLAITLVAGAVCVPWTWRNYSELGTICVIRSNFGLELRVGNHEGASADIDVSAERGTLVHPRTDRDEARRVARLGEAAFMRAARDQAVDWIVEHPAQFARLTVNRALFFWFGSIHRPASAAVYTLLTVLAVVGGIRALSSLPFAKRAVLVVPLLTYPLVYYVVGYMPRYRIPIDWIVLLLAGVAVTRTTATVQRHTEGRYPG